MFYEPFLKICAPQVAALVDPDKADEGYLRELIVVAEKSNLDWFFVGGSTVSEQDMDRVVSFLKSETKIPIVLFPGAANQVHEKADGLLFLSLLSGRNPEYLIGQQVKSAQKIMDIGLSVVPTAYLVLEGGKIATTSAITQTQPISDMDEIIHTALAGQLMGMKAVYLEAGSGAEQSVSIEIIKKVKSSLQAKLIVGGGIKDAATAKGIVDAGADVIVIGNAIEENVLLLKAICAAIKQ